MQISQQNSSGWKWDMQELRRLAEDIKRTTEKEQKREYLENHNAHGMDDADQE